MYRVIFKCLITYKNVQTAKFKHVPQLYSYSNNEGHPKFLTLCDL